MRIRRTVKRSFLTVLALYLSLVVGSYFLSGCESTPYVLQTTPSQPQEPARLRVMTYNVKFDVAPSLSADTIVRANPDVVFLQESMLDWENYARAQLAGQYPYILFHHEPYAGGSGVLSRYPITELFYEKPPAGWMHGSAVKVKTPAGEVKFLNVHLRPAASGQGGLSYLGYFRLPEVHWLEMDHLYKKLTSEADNLPTVVLGDFNESDKGAAIYYLIERGFADALPPFDPHTKTWHGSLAGISLSERCDHIVYSSHFKCLDAAVLKEGASDHRPVVAVLEKSN